VILKNVQVKNFCRSAKNEVDVTATAKRIKHGGEQWGIASGSAAIPTTAAFRLPRPFFV